MATLRGTLLQERVHEGARNKFAAVAVLLKATYTQEDADATLSKTRGVERKLREMKLNSAADVYAKGVREMLTYLGFHHEHWRNIRTNNILERLNHEIRRRMRVVGCFPDGESALMLVCARLRHVASYFSLNLMSEQTIFAKNP